MLCISIRMPEEMFKAIQRLADIKQTTFTQTALLLFENGLEGHGVEYEIALTDE